MIIYFSATGNCKYVAERIAEHTNDKAVSILDIGNSIVLTDRENLGFVFPTYHWGLPSVVDDFLSRVRIQNAEQSYIFFVATYGTTCGQTGTFVERHLCEKRLSLNGRYSIKMPDVWTPVFDLRDKEKVAEINKREIPQIKEIIAHIQNHDNGDFMKAKIPMLAVKLYRPMYEKDRQTSHLHVLDSCVGCGLCARNCPVKAIEIKQGKPHWVKEKCVMCLCCLHHCPKFAIQYDNKTEKHGQYHHPNMKFE